LGHAAKGGDGEPLRRKMDRLTYSHRFLMFIVIQETPATRGLRYEGSTRIRCRGGLYARPVGQEKGNGPQGQGVGGAGSKAWYPGDRYTVGLAGVLKKWEMWLRYWAAISRLWTTNVSPSREVTGFFGEEKRSKVRLMISSGDMSC